MSLGTLLALVVFLAALVGVIGLLPTGSWVLWLVLLLALAILVSGVSLPWGKR